MHRGKRYEGQHEPIIDRATFEKVQSALAGKRKLRRTGEQMKAPSLLAGLLFDGDGERYSTARTLRRDRRYRYYVAPPRAGRPGFRVPAAALEACVVDTLLGHVETPDKLLTILNGLPVASLALAQERARAWTLRLRSEVVSEVRTTLADLVRKIVYADETLRITISAGALIGEERWASSTHDVTSEVQLRRRGSDIKLVVHVNGAPPAVPDGKIVEALARGCAWFDELQTGAVASMTDIAVREGLSPNYVSDLVELAFLSPKLKERILTGRHAAGLTLLGLKRLCPLPLAWPEQHKILSAVLA